MNHAENLRDSYPAVADSVPRAREAVAAIAAAAGANENQLNAVRLAVSEALTNAVIHGYRGDHAGTIDVSAAAGTHKLKVSVGDHGHGLQVDRHRRGLGMGLALMALTSDELTIAERSSGGIEVHLGFNLDDVG